MIPGNHEYFFGYRAWMAHFTAMEMRVLENNHAVLERDGGRLVLAGVTDLSESHSAHPAPDLVGALKGRPRTPPSSCATISPGKQRGPPCSAWRCNCPGTPMVAWCSGSTGGRARQQRIRLGRDDVDGMTLYVNNETGLWPGFALRPGRPSELTRITLRRGA